MHTTTTFEPYIETRAERKARKEREEKEGHWYDIDYSVEMGIRRKFQNLDDEHRERNVALFMSGYSKAAEEFSDY